MRKRERENIECARASDDGEFVKAKPELAKAISYVHTHLGNRITDELVTQWWTERSFAGWRNKDGSRIMNWPFDLMTWANYFSVRQRAQDPDRIPDARKGRKGRRSHSSAPANFLEADEEMRKEFRDALG